MINDLDETIKQMLVKKPHWSHLKWILPLRLQIENGLHPYPNRR